MKKTRNNREYVTFCILIYKLETAYRFLLSAKIAKYLSLNSDADMELLDTFWPCFWGRIETKLKTADEKMISVNEFDILDYDAPICLLFCENRGKVEFEAQRRIIWRMLFIRVLLETLNKKRVLNQPAWTDNDFCQAARFFKEDYPIAESFESMNLGDDFDGEDAEVYNKIRKFYEEINLPEMPLYALRKEIQAKQRERTQKRNRKRSFSEPVLRLLDALGSETLSAVEIMNCLGLKHRPNFCENYLAPALNVGAIERTIPSKPRSRNQRYRKK